MEKDNLITELNSSENISINGGWIGFVAGFVLWNVVLKQLGTVRASNYIYLNPLVTMIASFLILDEKITLVAVLRR